MAGLLLSLSASLFLCLNVLAQADPVSMPIVKNVSGLIIKLKQTSAANTELVNINGNKTTMKASTVEQINIAAGIQAKYMHGDAGTVHVMKFTNMQYMHDALEICQRVAALEWVEYAEPDIVIKPTALPSDPAVNDAGPTQWYIAGSDIAALDLSEAWDVTIGEPSAVVAIIDTGITPHEDLDSSRITGGYDFISETVRAGDADGRDNNPRDEGDFVDAATSNALGCDIDNFSSWHGTQTSSIVAATSNNSTPNLHMTGINQNARVLPIRVLGRCGGLTSDLADAIRWAAGLSVSGVPNNPTPAKVINMSLGGTGFCGQTLQNAINAARNAGAVVVAAAGNSGANVNISTPANCAGVVAVAGLSNDGDRAAFSNIGAGIQISAPAGAGKAIYVAIYDGMATFASGSGGSSLDSQMYSSVRGTSLAAPMVSGVVSLIFSADPGLHASHVEQILRTSVEPFPETSSCDTSICGYGMLNAANAVQAVATFVPLADTVAISNNGGGWSWWQIWLGFYLITILYRIFVGGHRRSYSQ